MRRSANAWESFSFIDIVLLLTILVAIGVAVMSANAQSVNLPVAGQRHRLPALGILCVLLILFRIIDPPDLVATTSAFDIDTDDLYDVGRSIGVFLGLIAAGGIAYGGFVAMQEEGTSFCLARRIACRTGAVGPPPPPAGTSRRRRSEPGRHPSTRRPPPRRPRVSLGGVPTMRAPMIDRDQVLHVARLARLRLDEEEVERMARELSGILEHVEAIAALDLDGVEPTTHVVALENVLGRTSRRPASSASRRSPGRPTHTGDSFRVPSPQA